MLPHRTRNLIIPLIAGLASFSVSIQAFAKYGYDCTANEPSCVQNYNRNLHTSHGQKRVVVAPLNFSDTNWSPGAANMRSIIKRVDNFYETVSRGKYGFSDVDIRSTRQVDLPKSCGNRSRANDSVSNIQSFDLRIFSYPDKTCSYGGNAGGKTVNMNSGNIGNTMTMRHEIGHILRLTHSRDYERGNCSNEKGFCYDKTTLMGAQNTQNYNAPELHWLGWFEKHEVERILPGKLEYQLRAIDKNNNPGNAPLALVYDIPHTGNRLFIAMPKSPDTLKAGEGRLSSHELVIYVASPCKRCTFQKSILFERFSGNLQDETGLNIEVVDAVDTANVTLHISHSSHHAQCTQPPEFEVSQSLQRTLGKNQDGKVKLTIKARNDNPSGCRPMMIVDGDRAEVWSQSGDRELSRKADGAVIKALDKKGINYIFTESDSAKNPKTKPYMSWDFEVKSSAAEQVLARIEIVNFPVIEVPVNFKDGDSTAGGDSSSDDNTAVQDPIQDGGNDPESPLKNIEASRMVSGVLEVDHEPTLLPLPDGITFNDPVVLAGVPSFRGKDPVVAESLSGKNQLFMQLNEWRYLDAWHTNETVPFLVAEAGGYQAEGVQIEFGHVSLDALDEDMVFSFQHSFEAPPLVLLTVRNNGNAMPIAVRLSSVNRDEFTLRGFLEEKLQSEVSQIEGIDIGYMALHGEAAENDSSIVLDLPTLTSPATLNYERMLVNDDVSTHPVFIQEEQSANKETRHVNETLGLVTMDGLRFGTLQTTHGADPLSLRQQP
ncbi:hypothetical protein [Allohahella marinimesophila]|uniref:Astacin (Peptidase family M12A) n=1 Tax=Allohahella marinimesophila TaxID=1054972 RepID=A0ABP7PGN8_9GAMM